MFSSFTTPSTERILEMDNTKNVAVEEIPRTLMPTMEIVLPATIDTDKGTFMMDNSELSTVLVLNTAMSVLKTKRVLYEEVVTPPEIMLTSRVPATLELCSPILVLEKVALLPSDMRNEAVLRRIICAPPPTAVL